MTNGTCCVSLWWLADKIEEVIFFFFFFPFGVYTYCISYEYISFPWKQWKIGEKIMTKTFISNYVVKNIFIFIRVRYSIFVIKLEVWGWDHGFPCENGPYGKFVKDIKKYSV